MERCVLLLLGSLVIIYWYDVCWYLPVVILFVILV